MFAILVRLPADIRYTTYRMYFGKVGQKRVKKETATRHGLPALEI